MRGASLARSGQNAQRVSELTPQQTAGGTIRIVIPLRDGDQVQEAQAQ